jgi:hypothetical protein
MKTSSSGNSSLTIPSRSRPLIPGIRTSVMRQQARSSNPDLRASAAELKSAAMNCAALNRLARASEFMARHPRSPQFFSDESRRDSPSIRPTVLRERWRAYYDLVLYERRSEHSELCGHSNQSRDRRHTHLFQDLPSMDLQGDLSDPNLPALCLLVNPEAINGKASRSTSCQPWVTLLQIREFCPRFVSVCDPGRGPCESH